MVQRITALAPRQPRLLERALAILSTLLPRDEPVEVVEQRFNFLPHRFRWRGDMRRVRAVAQVWEQPGAGWRPARRYFEVICGQDRRYVLFQDVQLGTWHMNV